MLLGSLRLSGPVSIEFLFMSALLAGTLVFADVSRLQRWMDSQGVEVTPACVFSVYVLLWWASGGLLPLLVALVGWLMAYGAFYCYVTSSAMAKRLNAPKGATDHQLTAL
jgi:hypothetical protein